MWWIFAVIVVLVLSVSLYDFYVTKQWDEVTHAVNSTQTKALNERHKRANAIRRTYNRLMLIILGGLGIVAASALVANETISGYAPAALLPLEQDTTQMLVEAPPLDDVTTVEETYEIKGNAAIDQNSQQAQEAREGKETPDDNENPTSQPQQNAPEKPPLPNAAVTPSTEIKRPKNMTDADWAVYKRGEEIRLEGIARAAAKKKAQEEKDALLASQSGSKPKNDKAPPQGSKVGTADVDWSKQWRKAYGNNDDLVPTPKYMCDFSGKVVILVKVNADGTVKSAESLTTGVAGCLIDNAKKYAMRARFEASSKIIDEGKLTYTFY